MKKKKRLFNPFVSLIGLFCFYCLPWGNHLHQLLLQRHHLHTIWSGLVRAAAAATARHHYEGLTLVMRDNKELERIIKVKNFVLMDSWYPTSGHFVNRRFRTYKKKKRKTFSAMHLNSLFTSNYAPKLLVLILVYIWGLIRVYLHNTVEFVFVPCTETNLTTL